MSSSEKPPEPPVAADGGFAGFRRDEGDPYLALDDLMAAVETLCPVWPRRETFKDGGRMLL